MKISIIIPILNEEKNLPQLVSTLSKLTPQPNNIVIVDGGSDDDSVAVAQNSGLTIITAERGRASQQNTGAEYAIKTYQPDLLLFLHADTQLPKNGLTLISEHFSDKDNHKFWGRFDVQLDSTHWLLKLVSFMINWRSRITGIATGDQAIFINANLFEQVNGFANIPLMEDVEICKRLRRLTKPICIKEKAITSARRWEKHGRVKTIVLMWRLRFEYWLGVSPDKLAVDYGYVPNNQTENQTKK